MFKEIAAVLSVVLVSASAVADAAPTKGDTLTMVAYVRVIDPVAGAWHMLTVSGTSPIDVKSGDAGAGMLLGGAKQTVDIGSVFVFNLGQGGAPVK